MAVISGFNQGNVSDEGKKNWRGDQVSLDNQSVFDESTVPLAQLGSRKVVGDRVFRYGTAGEALTAGDVVGVNPVADAACTVGGLGVAGDKVFTYYSSAGRAADYFAEGYVVNKTGTDGNRGMMYRIKSHPVVSALNNVVLSLYDPLAISVLTSAAGLWFCVRNPYASVIAATANVQAVMGAAPIAVTSGNYFWMQTWGPCPCKGGTCTPGSPVVPTATGAVVSFVQATTVAGAQFVGIAMSNITASTNGLVFLQIAP